MTMTNGEAVEAATWLTIHPASAADRDATASLRAAVAPQKGRMRGPLAREAFDTIMRRVSLPAAVTFEAGTVGDVAGWWCRPHDASPDGAILHLHGGWYTWGTAEAFRNLVGHISATARAAAFVPDYHLAPEYPFPAASIDARACFAAMAAAHPRVAVTGDSAGGGLMLGLLGALAGAQAADRPVAAVALSPVTDLTQSGASWWKRSDADPYFTREQVAELVAAYLAGHDPADGAASPLFGDLSELPPLRIHVGGDEVLHDDSHLYVERAVAAGADAKLDVWEGVPHGFLAGVGRLEAANAALEKIGTFLSNRLRA